MDSFKTIFDPLDLEIIDQGYDVAWARIQAREPSGNIASDSGGQEALRRKIFGIARVAGPLTHRLRHSGRDGACDNI